VLDNGDWSQLVSAKVGADGSRPKTEPAALHGAIVGNIVGFIGDVLLVTFSGQVGSDPVPCRTTVDVGRHRVGDQALLIFEQGDARRPILVGCLKESTSASAPAVELKADDETVTVTAKERIVLRCGKASLTLTKAGKVILQGEYISQRSMGVVRIKGGCVEIN
jgi:hypothetical protein